MWDADTPRKRVADRKEWEQILQEVRAALEEYGTIYKHQVGGAKRVWVG